MPLQNPQRRKRELTRQNVKRTFLPSARTNMPCLVGLFALWFVASNALGLVVFIDAAIG
jgi:hypothetical protein